MLLANTEISIHLSFGLLFATVCALLATGRGRSGLAWFALGLVFQCFALVLLLVLPDLNEQRSRYEELDQNTRRLREQLAKERQVADRRHQQVQHRLGQHDQALGIDSLAPAGLGAGEPPPLPDDVMWYYGRGQERCGPVSGDTLRHLLQAKAIHRDTLVWCDAMPDWAPLRSIAAFRADLS
jgi:hypothetical protein